MQSMTCCAARQGALAGISRARSMHSKDRSGLLKTLRGYRIRMMTFAETDIYQGVSTLEPIPDFLDLEMSQKNYKI
jgi:hypothetical protein